MQHLNLCFLSVYRSLLIFFFFIQLEPQGCLFEIQSQPYLQFLSVQSFTCTHSSKPKPPDQYYSCLSMKVLKFCGRGNHIFMLIVYAPCSHSFHTQLGPMLQQLPLSFLSKIFLYHYHPPSSLIFSNSSILTNYVALSSMRKLEVISHVFPLPHPDLES